MNKMKNCSFCSREIYLKFYVCECDQNVIACIHCSAFGCYKCSKQFKGCQQKYCSICQKYQYDFKLFSYKYSKICVKCCTEQLQKNKKQETLYISHNYVKRSQLQKFVSRFCVTCSRTLDLKDNKLQKSHQFTQCSQCINKKQGKKSDQQQKVVRPNQKVDKNDPVERQPVKYKQKPKDIQVPEKVDRIQEQNKKQYFEKWKKTQGKSYSISCISCNSTIYEDRIKKATINDEVAICQICSKFSQIQQKQIDKLNFSRIIPINNQSASKKDERRQLQRQIIKPENDNSNKNSSIKQPKQSIIEEHQRQNKSPSKNQNMQQSQKAINKQKQIEHKQSNQKKDLKKSRNIKQIVLKKSDSQARLQNIELQIKWVNDSDIIQCAECNIQIQAISSIWEEQKNKPLCRRCYADLLAQIQQQYWRNKRKSPINLGPRRTFMQKYHAIKKDSPTKKLQNAIDEPSTIEKQKYEQKRFGNLNKQKFEAKLPVYKQKQENKQQKGKLEISRQQIKLNNLLDKDPIKPDIIGTTMKKVEQASSQKQKPISEKNNAIEMRDSYYNSPAVKKNGNALSSFVQANRRYTSSYKPNPSVNQAAAKNNANLRNTLSKNESYKYPTSFQAKDACSICRKQRKSAKPYLIDGKLVCLDCISQYNERNYRLNKIEGRVVKTSYYN